MDVPQPSGLSSLENQGIGWNFNSTPFLLIAFDFTNPSVSASFVIWQNGIWGGHRHALNFRCPSLSPVPLYDVLFVPFQGIGSSIFVAD